MFSPWISKIPIPIIMVSVGKTCHTNQDPFHQTIELWEKNFLSHRLRHWPNSGTKPWLKHWSFPPQQNISSHIDHKNKKGPTNPQKCQKILKPSLFFNNYPVVNFITNPPPPSGISLNDHLTETASHPFNPSNHLIHPLASASRTASAVAASLAMASSVALRASANSWAIRVRKSQCASSQMLGFFPKEQRNLCETSVGKKNTCSRVSCFEGETKTTIQTKDVTWSLDDWEKNCDPNNKKSGSLDFGDWPPPKILTNSVNSKQGILGHVWEFCSLSRIHE